MQVVGNLLMRCFDFGFAEHAHTVAQVLEQALIHAHERDAVDRFHEFVHPQADRFEDKRLPALVFGDPTVEIFHRNHDKCRILLCHGVHFALFVAHAATEGHCTGVAALEVIKEKFVAFLVLAQDLDRAFEHDRHVRKRIADMHEGLPQLDAAQLADGGDFLHQVVFEHEAEMFLDLRVQFLIHLLCFAASIYTFECSF